MYPRKLTDGYPERIMTHFQLTGAHVGVDAVPDTLARCAIGNFGIKPLQS